MPIEVATEKWPATGVQHFFRFRLDATTTTHIRPFKAPEALPQIERSFSLLILAYLADYGMAALDTV
jgi:hypothetical protein